MQRVQLRSVQYSCAAAASDRNSPDVDRAERTSLTCRAVCFRLALGLRDRAKRSATERRNATELRSGN